MAPSSSRSTVLLSATLALVAAFAWHPGGVHGHVITQKTMPIGADLAARGLAVPEDAIYAATLAGSGEANESPQSSWLFNGSASPDAPAGATPPARERRERDAADARALVTVLAAVVAAVAFAACCRGDAPRPAAGPRRAGKQRLLLLMSDTGGGHRASAEALVGALEQLHPGRFECDVYDIWTDAAPWPLNQIVPLYRWLGARPAWWCALWYGTAAPGCKQTNRIGLCPVAAPFASAIAAKDPDLVVSVHPLCQEFPLQATRALERASGRRVPFATVVTDLGSAHPTWFDGRADACFVPGDRVAHLAKAHGVAPSAVVQHGLPLRAAFADHAAAADAAPAPTRAAADAERAARRASLGVSHPERAAALIVGGGEGMGGLGAIVEAAWAELARPGMGASTLIVVCGKNEELRAELAARDWGERVDVVVLGFVKNMHEYMAGADVLLTKAGPGTIAEAATMALPTLLTSHLPGQEAGNVKYVINGRFGAYATEPKKIGAILAEWLRSPEQRARMAAAARAAANPKATLDIARDLAKMVM